MWCFFFYMVRRPPRSNRTDTFCPCPTIFRAQELAGALRGGSGDDDEASGASGFWDVSSYRISRHVLALNQTQAEEGEEHADGAEDAAAEADEEVRLLRDRKSTRLNSSQ